MMPNRPVFAIRPVNRGTSSDELRAVRRAVFIEEQRVPEALEWDDVDERCHHVPAVNNDGTPIGTGRLRSDGYIGCIMDAGIPHRKMRIQSEPPQKMQG